MKSGKNKKPYVAESSGNVFADLALPDAKELQAKVRLVVAINEIIRSHEISHAVAASWLKIKQPKISALSNYWIEGFSLERLMHFLTALDRDVEILIRRKPKSGKSGRIFVTAA